MRNKSILPGGLQKAVRWVILAGLLLPAVGRAGGPPPVITVQPGSISVPLLGIATFSVSASSGTKMSYQWYKDGAAIYGANSSSYTILSVLDFSAGNYFVQVINSGGWVLSDNATLNIVAAPAIITQPQSQTVVRNQNVSFSVVASGTGPLGYQWFFNGASLGTAGTNATLTLISVKATQAGAYTVVMTNALGSITSAAAMLTILVPPGIATQPQSQSVVQGQTVSFSVMANGTQPLSYQWKFNGSVLPGATASTLTLANVQTNQAGSYLVLVTNVAGSDTSSSASLSVSLPSVTLSVDSSATVRSSSFGVQLSVPAGLTYVLLASSDLQTWTPIATNVATSGSITFTDAASANLPCRFYRALIPPTPVSTAQ